MSVPVEIISTASKATASRQDTTTKALPDIPTQPSEIVYDQWALQLSPLASQHHMSEYSRMKYGHSGSPVPYEPLSLHSPELVRELRERQIKNENQPLWWPSLLSFPAHACVSTAPPTQQEVALVPGESNSQVQLELCNAISERISKPYTGQNNNRFTSPLKTSETHPIHISPIIPPGLLLAVSSHLTPCPRPSPVLFDISPSYSLDLVVGYKHPCPSFVNAPMIPVRSSYSVDVQLPHVSPRLPKNLLESRTSISDALRIAIGTKLSIPPLRLPLSRSQSLKRTSKNGGNKCNKAAEVASMLPKILLPRQPVLPPLSQQTRSYSEPPDTCYPPTVDLVKPNGLSSLSEDLPVEVSMQQMHAVKEEFGKLHTEPGNKKDPRFKLGNLLLSSCPGKKAVRLDGPARGKIAVFRNLEHDIKRLRDAGARCLVCCLADDELNFLGIAWQEYCRIAHKEGLDVLRIPLPEGLCPLSPQSLDANLTLIIERYTLRSAAVLVHCRGGVGRAGLVACCWLLKLGLCGWIETDAVDGTDNDTFMAKWDSDTITRRDTLQLVERVIGVLRIRRSVKAIETLEQVQFIAEYVEYLRARGGRAEIVRKLGEAPSNLEGAATIQ